MAAQGVLARERVMNRRGLRVPLHSMGIPDRYSFAVGGRDKLLENIGLDEKRIAEAARQASNKSNQ